MLRKLGTKDMKKTTPLKFITRTAILAALTIVFQMIGLPQMVTGPIVNMLLLTATVMVGAASGAVVGLITPFIALQMGILKPVMAPMMPWISISNVLLCITFAVVLGLISRKENVVTKIIACIPAAFVKFFVLSAVVRWIVDLPAPAAAMMQGTQLVTALIGGVAAAVFTELLIKLGVK